METETLEQTGLTTREELLKFWNQFESVVARWDATPEAGSSLMLTWRGVTVKSISKTLEEALAGVGAVVNSVDFEPDCWEVVLAMWDFWGSVQDWAVGIHQDPINTDPSGGQKLWHHLGLIREAIRVKNFPQVEPIQQLVATGVKPEQIAEIYGWKLDNGSPDVVKVQNEINKPGSEMDWSKWVHPEQRIRNEKIKILWNDHVEKFYSLPDPSAVFDPDSYDQQKKHQKPIEPAPESIEELLNLPGMTVQQVADMKQIDPDEVRRVAADLFVPIDHEVAGMMAMASTDREMKRARELSERGTASLAADVHDYPENESMEERVWLMNDDGTKPGMILNMLKKSYPGLTYAGIVDLINRKPKVEKSIDEKPGKAGGDSGRKAKGVQAKNGP